MYITREEALEDDEADTKYHSASDEDFAPPSDNDASGASDSSEDEDEDAATAAAAGKKAKKGKKRKAPRLEDDGELDSGDEATMNELKRKKARKEEEGESSEEEMGGLVRTRAQRAKDTKERRPLARTDGATADVDAIWASMMSKPLGREPDPEPAEVPASTTNDTAQAGATSRAESIPKPAQDDADYITISRTYTFAGETHHEQKRVLRSSEEARLYLASKAKESEGDKENTLPNDTDADAAQEDKDTASSKPKLRRPLRRPSRFEPNPTGEVRGLAPEAQLRWPRATANHISGSLPTTAGSTTILNKSQIKKQPPNKVNTVEKSRLDWAGYVDKEGIADELDEYGRSKGAYGGRMEFLERVGRREEEGRRAVKPQGE